jgi:hypothetical protein
MHTSLALLQRLLCLDLLVTCAGQEVAFAREKGLPEPPASLDPSLLSRLLLCHYAGLVTSLDKLLGDPGLAQSAAAQALQLHTLLK